MNVTQYFIDGKPVSEVEYILACRINGWPLPGPSREGIDIHQSTKTFRDPGGVYEK